MTQLIEFREKIKEIYQKYEQYINPTIRFFVAFIVFALINSKLGYDSKLGEFPVVLALSAISAFVPSSIVVLLAVVVTAAHIYTISPVLSVIAVVILVILYLLFARFTPELGYVILAVPILFILNIPYVIPILLGLTATPIAIIPVSCGVVVYYLFATIRDIATTISTTSKVDDILHLYESLLNQLLANKTMLLTICIFAVVLLITYMIRKLEVNHAFEIAIVAGGTTNILFFLIGDLVVDATYMILSMIAGTVLSCFIAYAVQFFYLSLDYTSIERVQFEDENYYYYVKAVPKIKVTTPEVSVKHFNAPKASKSAKEVMEERERLRKQRLQDRKNSGTTIDNRKNSETSKIQNVQSIQASSNIKKQTINDKKEQKQVNLDEMKVSSKEIQNKLSSEKINKNKE